jgi:hypothetical protein
MLDRSGVVIGDWVEKAWPAPVIVCIATACAFAEVDVGEGWRVGWRSQRGLAGDREWYVLGSSRLETRSVNSARQRRLELRGRRGFERLKAGGVE